MDTTNDNSSVWGSKIDEAQSRDLVTAAKTWIQAPANSTPIEFEDVWDLDGSTHRGYAKQRLEKMFNDLVSYGLASTSEVVEISTTPTSPNSPVKEVKSYRMSYNVFKHYISSSQTERGYRTRAKLHQAEEELLAIKANPMLAFPPGMIETMNNMMVSIADTNAKLAEVQRVQAETNAILVRITDRLTLVEEKVNPIGMSMDDLLVSSKEVLDGWEAVRAEYRLMIPDVEEAEKQARRSFGKMLATAGRHAGAIIQSQNGVKTYNERKIREIVSKLEAPVQRFKARARNRYKPAAGQNELGF